MVVFVGETHDFIFDAGAVARTDARNVPPVHRRPMQIRANDGVGAFVGGGLPTREQGAWRVKRVVQIRERRARLRRDFLEL